MSAIISYTRIAWALINASPRRRSRSFSSRRKSCARPAITVKGLLISWPAPAANSASASSFSRSSASAKRCSKSSACAKRAASRGKRSPAAGAGANQGVGPRRPRAAWQRSSSTSGLAGPGPTRSPGPRRPVCPRGRQLGLAGNRGAAPRGPQSRTGRRQPAATRRAAGRRIPLAQVGLPGPLGQPDRQLRRPRGPRPRGLPRRRGPALGPARSGHCSGCGRPVRGPAARPATRLPAARSAARSQLPSPADRCTAPGEGAGMRGSERRNGLQAVQPGKRSTTTRAGRPPNARRADPPAPGQRGWASSRSTNRCAEASAMESGQLRDPATNGGRNCIAARLAAREGTPPGFVRSRKVRRKGDRHLSPLLPD